MFYFILQYIHLTAIVTSYFADYLLMTLYKVVLPQLGKNIKILLPC